MAVIGIDSSGVLKNPPESVWMTAVRKANVQKHNILFLSVAECERYRKGININWREKLAAALIFKSLQPLIKHSDMIQIDTDFQGQRRKYVEQYLRGLFGTMFRGTSLSSVKIQFIPADYSVDVQLAHGKSWKARHKSMDCVHICPNLDKLLSYLD